MFSDRSFVSFSLHATWLWAKGNNWPRKCQSMRDGNQCDKWFCKGSPLKFFQQNFKPGFRNESQKIRMNCFTFNWITIESNQMSEIRVHFSWQRIRVHSSESLDKWDMEMLPSMYHAEVPFFQVAAAVPLRRISSNYVIYWSDPTEARNFANQWVFSSLCDWKEALTPLAIFL